MKQIEVSAAIIIKDKKIFVTQRGYGEFKDYWEFPGGKLEANEDPKSCIVREIKEELDASISVVHFLNTIEYTYPTFKLTMHNFVCKLKDDHISLLEHEAAKFIDVKELDKINFLPANLLILEDLKNYITNNIL